MTDEEENYDADVFIPKNLPPTATKIVFNPLLKLKCSSCGYERETTQDEVNVLTDHPLHECGGTMVMVLGTPTPFKAVETPQEN